MTKKKSINIGKNTSAPTPASVSVPAASPASTPPQTQPQCRKKLIVLCDGTWCGSETGTKSNIYLLAKMIGIPINELQQQQQQQEQHQQEQHQQEQLRQSQQAQREQYEREQQPSQLPRGSINTPDIKACYFPGAGLRGTFLEYLFNGATGNDIDRNCIEVYGYIVQHFTREHEIWMFGLSRGAYTIRCVAGMINNCGILKRRNADGSFHDQNTGDGLTSEEKDLCKEVYKIYRSRDPTDHPEASRSTTFRRRASHHVRTPVKFMGLFDTVGGLGIPYLNPGIGLTFHEFHDTKVSAVVEKVYHALSIHDRLWIFEPCHALPDKKRIDSEEVKFEIHERWFPGCHYDLGRQQFRFFRDGQNWLERPLDNLVRDYSRIIYPNEPFADFVLKWMLESIQKHSGRDIIQDIDDQIDYLHARMMTGNEFGSGDVYGNILPYGPLGSVWEKLAYPSFQPFKPLTRISNRILDRVNNLLGTTGNILHEGINTGEEIADAIFARLDLPSTSDTRSIFKSTASAVKRVVFTPLNLTRDVFQLFMQVGMVGMIGGDLAIIFSSQFLFREFRIVTDVLAQTRTRRILDSDKSWALYEKDRTEAEMKEDSEIINRKVPNYHVSVTLDEEVGGTIMGRVKGKVEYEYKSTTYSKYQRYCEVMKNA
ncbi:hypothetical protein BG015_001359 [Linnemannia schmuckeri]|uniref:T6SS Phospholipase effector Tle1-like catalytic domain-containing protein n=1 Tax=Linnemannia schmuckeri TaxID=64567 RepID=A0A9P5RRX6_9FUNG|nr:hypothetical protein BG015_001359 [Linnemannia schmuckeri]